jgi:hypothetical protein
VPNWEYGLVVVQGGGRDRLRLAPRSSDSSGVILDIGDRVSPVFERFAVLFLQVSSGTVLRG